MLSPTRKHCHERIGLATIDPVYFKLIIVKEYIISSFNLIGLIPPVYPVDM
jgi:hypothetical protein